jgi:hypothetical protein
MMEHLFGPTSSRADVAGRRAKNLSHGRAVPGPVALDRLGQTS